MGNTTLNNYPSQQIRRQSNVTSNTNTAAAIPEGLESHTSSAEKQITEATKDEEPEHGRNT